MRPVLENDGLLCVLDELEEFDTLSFPAEKNADEKLKELQIAFKEYQILVQEKLLGAESCNE